MAKSGIYAFGVIYQTKVVYVYQDKIGHVEKGKISIWIRLSIFRVAGCFMNKRIGFIGCGNMGKAMLGSLVKSKDINNEDIMVSTKSNTSAQNIIKEFNVKATTINSEVTKNSDIIFLAVKPFFFKEVIEEIKDVVKEDVIIISIAAGVTIEQIEEWFGKKIKLVRTMPNTPALVGEGMSAICPNNNVSEEELNYIGKLYNLFGKYEVIAEKDFHAFIALCGSSPAYVFMFIEAMADAAVADGMPRAQAYKFAAQAVLGSAKMVLETGKHPGELKDAVCSPGGTTIEAVATLEKAGLRNAVIEAQRACVQKSRNMNS